jgi:UDP-3-O-[3-hydroxymyristoyl] glucosamine N-acyltransferase
MKFTAAQIAGFVNGKIIGNPDEQVSNFSPIETASHGDLSFVAQERFADLLENSDCSVVIVSEKFLGGKTPKPTIIAVEDAYLSFQILMNLYQNLQQKKSGIEQPSFIHETAKIGENAYIGAFSYISENSQIGAGTEIFPQVFIGKNVKIGNNCKINSEFYIFLYTIFIKFYRFC